MPWSKWTFFKTFERKRIKIKAITTIMMMLTNQRTSLYKIRLLTGLTKTINQNQPILGLFSRSHSFKLGVLNYESTVILWFSGTLFWPAVPCFGRPTKLDRFKWFWNHVKSNSTVAGAKASDVHYLSLRGNKLPDEKAVAKLVKGNCSIFDGWKYNTIKVGMSHSFPISIAVSLTI